MSAEKNWQFELEEYIKQGEPGQIEKSEAWQTAIGLQAVDGLKTSAYLLDTAKEHIEGKSSIDEAQKRIQSYYEQRTDVKDQLYANRTGILYIMGDVLRTLVRFKITGHGIVYTVKITPFADDIMQK